MPGILYSAKLINQIEKKCDETRQKQKKRKEKMERQPNNLHI